MGRHQDQQARHREERPGDHDRPPPAEPSVEAVGPGAHDRRHCHRQQAADGERRADGGVLLSLWDYLVNLSLYQDGGQRKPEEVGPKPEGAQRRVLQVSELRWPAGGRGNR